MLQLHNDGHEPPEVQWSVHVVSACHGSGITGKNALSKYLAWLAYLRLVSLQSDDAACMGSQVTTSAEEEV